MSISIGSTSPFHSRPQRSNLQLLPSNLRSPWIWCPVSLVVCSLNLPLQLNAPQTWNVTVSPFFRFKDVHCLIFAGWQMVSFATFSLKRHHVIIFAACFLVKTAIFYLVIVFQKWQLLTIFPIFPKLSTPFTHFSKTSWFSTLVFRQIPHVFRRFSPFFFPRLSPFFQWIGLRENLQETMVFTIKYRGFL